jgi:hypothetical protein
LLERAVALAEFSIEESTMERVEISAWVSVDDVYRSAPVIESCIPDYSIHLTVRILEVLADEVYFVGKS